MRSPHSERRNITFQMHPVLRHMKASRHPDLSSDSVTDGESHGLARVTTNPEQHPRCSIKKDSSVAIVPKQNVFRDAEGSKGQGIRDIRFKSGRDISVDTQRVISDDDFEYDEDCPISTAKAHLQAADLVTAYEQTTKQEANFQKSFNNNVRTLVAREEVTMGLMHLWDFVQAFFENPTSRSLTAQLLLIAQHVREEGIFKETLLNITEPENRWLSDLINILQSIIVQERCLRLGEKVAAINYSVVTLGKFYARKIFKSVFVPIDKEIKIDTFYMRMVLKVLCLCDDLGIYRVDTMQRLVSNSRRREMTDTELMYNLRRALSEGENLGIDKQDLRGRHYRPGLADIFEEEQEDDLHNSPYYSNHDV